MMPGFLVDFPSNQTRRQAPICPRAGLKPSLALEQKPLKLHESTQGLLKARPKARWRGGWVGQVWLFAPWFYVS